MAKNKTMKNIQPSILIVDRDASARDMLATFLAGRYSCTVAATAEKAIGLLTFSPFDLVITDRDLPGVSGLALCQYVKKYRPDTTVILMSARVTQWQRTVAGWLGVFDCIKKPCDFAGLSDLVESALKGDEHQQGDERTESVEGAYQPV